MPILGTPYERGQSDVIVSRAYPDGLGQGLAVGEHIAADGELKMQIAAPFIGVTGEQRLVAMNEIKSSLKVYVQANKDDEVINVGQPVYVVPASGKFTQVTEGNTLVNATARSKIVDCVDSNGNAFKGFAIDFPAGL